MSYYPKFKPVNGSYNPIDIITEPDELAKENEGQADLSTVVQKSGDTMFGVLIANAGIKFQNNNNVQTIPFTNEDKQKLNTINVNNGVLQLNSLKFTADNDLVNQTNAFTSTHKSKIDLIDEMKIDIGYNTYHRQNTIFYDFRITTNTTNIATNTTNIATNTTNIATNTTDISSNTTDIATNTTDISSNTTDIATNTTDIATNTTNISSNTTDIATNTTDIATNTTNIATNTTDISTNQSKLEVYSNTSTDIVFNDRTLNVKDSPIIDITNSLSANNKFDGAISFLRTGSVYRKWWLGSIGDNLNPQNNFNICVNGNTAEPENIFDLSPQGDLKIKGNFLVGNNGIIFNNNEVQQTAYTNELNTKLTNMIPFDNHLS